jgi:hypothetical protein
MHMTHDPRLRSSVAHLPTLEKIMNGNNPFELIDTPLGTMERWRAEAMLIGSTSGIQDVYRTIRDDASAAAARADEAQAQRTLIQHVLDQITEFERRFDAHVARLAEAEDKRRADEARKARFDEEEIELPPDLAARQASSPARKIEDDDTHAHSPGGELHSVAPKEEPSLSSELPEPPLEVEDAEGDLPPELHDPLDPVPEPRGKVVSQPVSISLNEE